MHTITEGIPGGESGISIGTVAKKAKAKKRPIAYDRSHARTVGPYQSDRPRVVCRDVNVYYGAK
ncbi:MAG: hypothetical protein ACRER2_07270, partial [Methylococcales bacterium]